MNKVVFITGVSSGFGLECAKLFLANGYTVYGVGTKDFSYDGINYFTCDISDYEKLKAVVDKVVEKEGKIDILLANAGMGISGPIEHTSVQDASRIMNVNFLGAFHTIKAVLPIMRQQNYGRIVVTSSVASFVPLPFQGFYSASKSALDNLIVALRAEISEYKNIKIVSVQPGDASTGFTDSRKKAENNADYAQCEKSVSKMEKDEKNGMTPLAVAKVMYKVATCNRPPLRRIVGGKYKFYAFVLGLLPQRMREWVVRKFY